MHKERAHLSLPAQMGIRASSPPAWYPYRAYNKKTGDDLHLRFFIML